MRARPVAGDLSGRASASHPPGGSSSGQRLLRAARRPLPRAKPVRVPAHGVSRSLRPQPGTRDRERGAPR